MGISGLLPFLKEGSVNVNIKQFEGSTVAVDTYCWIYRGAFSCAEELAIGQNADGHVKYVLKYVQKLVEWGIKPIMVFDGSCLPSKKNTELKRRESKEMYRKKAAQCLLEGRKNEARECFQRCIDCTPKMALDVIKALHAIGVDTLVAPYEADAQLAFLSKSNIAQIIITEDSDLIPFGCEKILYKLDMNGNGQLIQREKIISITQFDSADNFERFRWMCILSGCDYLENLPGIGLGKARKLLKTVQKSDIDFMLRQIPKVLKMPNLTITNEYVESFKRADKTFKYQIVFDPLKRKLASLNEYQNDINSDEDLSYAGFFYNNDSALQQALGNIDVHLKTDVYDFNPENWNYKPPLKYANNPPPHMKSIWSKSYQTYNKSNPFSNFLNNSITRPNTLGLTKTIKTPVNKNENKRKFETINEKEEARISNSGIVSSSTSSSTSSSQYLSSSNDSNQTNDNKRFKTEEIKVDIDNMLSQYYISENKNENDDLTNREQMKYSPVKLKESCSRSSYFANIQSPIVNKVSQISGASDEMCSQRDKETPTKLFFEEFRPISNSPVLNMNESKISPNKTMVNEILEKFSAKTNKFTLIKNDSTNDRIKHEPDVLVHNLGANLQKTKNVLDDLDSVLIKVEESSYKYDNNSLSREKQAELPKPKKSPIVTKLTNSKTTKKQNNAPPPNNKPITDFFSKFEFSKNSNNKFDKIYK